LGSSTPKNTPPRLCWGFFPLSIFLALAFVGWMGPFAVQPRGRRSAGRGRIGGKPPAGASAVFKKKQNAAAGGLAGFSFAVLAALFGRKQGVKRV